MARFIVGISGASGIVLGYRLVVLLASQSHNVELVMSPDAAYTALEEMGKLYAGSHKIYESLPQELKKYVTIHANNDFGARIASGTFPVDGMAIIPCSMATLAAVALGLSDNLIRRAADVTMKERRRLVIVPRESPLSEIHLENMLKLARMGVIIHPPQPAWYLKPQSIDDIEAFIVGRVAESLGVQTNFPRWEGVKPATLPSS